MQPPVFLWFEMEMTKQYLREKTFAPAPSPANSTGSNTSIGASPGIGNSVVQELLRRVPASWERSGNQTDSQRP